MSTGDGFDVRSLAFTYRDGHPATPHRHPWAQLIYALSGVTQVAVEDRLWFVPPTRAIWIAPGVTHQVFIKGEVAFRTLFIDPVRAGRLDRTVKVLEVRPLLRELVVHIVSIGMLDPKAPEHDRLAALLMDLVAQAPSKDLVLPLPRDARALRLASHLRSQPADKSDLETLAVEAGAGLRTLQRCFAGETGLTIEAWRQKARLVHAAMALSGGATVTDAAIDCGYDSLSAFIAAFRKQFGVTPGKFAAYAPDPGLIADPRGAGSERASLGAGQRLR
jgi:AraC-like DNA-binding protein